MRRVAFISTMCGYHPSVPRWAGCEELWGQTAHRLAARGIEVGVNVFRWPEAVRQIRALEQAGCRVKRRRTVPGLRRFGSWIPSAIHVRWINQFRPQLTVVTQHQFHTDIEWAEHCRRAKFSYALVVQAVDEAAELSPSLILRLRQNFLFARRCFFVSRRNLNTVEGRLGVSLPNSEVVRNPFQVPHDDAPAYPATTGVFSLACVGRLEPAKGQDLLLEVLAGEPWRGRELEVSFYGKGSTLSTLEAQAGAYTLKGTKFCGFVPDVRQVWAEHHALVLPSRSEGLPLALVEAMLCDRMAIVTGVGGNAELIAEGETGFIAPSPTATDLHKALERAWARRDDWSQMGRAAGARARELVPADPIRVFADKIEALLS